MTLEEAVKRIEELERRLAIVEAFPRTQYFPVPAQPAYPIHPYWWGNQPYCVNVGAGVA